MGLCKCERKDVTNMFCFEHRVNVCVYCLMSDHQKCIVKSYLHWLKDSDYSPVCALCSNTFDSCEADECIRLMCFDLFHWKCLDEYASKLPITTAPAGYECPSCLQTIIPLSNHGGPIAETLRTKLSLASWAKPNLRGKISSSKIKAKKYDEPKQIVSYDDCKLLDSSLDVYAARFLRGEETEPFQREQKGDSVALSIPSFTDRGLANSNLSASKSEPERNANESFNSAPMPGAYSAHRNILMDDDNKYKRRSPLKSSVNPVVILKLCYSFASRRHRWALIAGVLILVFLLSIWILSNSKEFDETDSMLLDPMMNPGIHVDAIAKH